MATVPQFTETPSKVFEPRTIGFPKVIQEKINEYLCIQIEAHLKRLRILHTSTVPEWRRILEGKPREKNKSFPFSNCSNLVAQLSGEAVDDLAARVLQLVMMTNPLAYFKYPEASDEKEATRNGDKSRALQRFFDNKTLDPRGLNLYPFLNKWFVDGAGLGKSRICVVPEQRMEQVYTGYHPGSNGKKDLHEFDDDKMLYEGPKVINLRYEDILTDPDVEVFEENDPIIRRVTIRGDRKLRERVFRGWYLKIPTEAILGQPDRYGPSEVKARENQRKGVADNSDPTLAEWDIYECYFSWWFNKKKFRLIAWVHKKTKTMLNCVYNFIPDNQVPIIETKITVDGRGAAEMLEDAQEEVSTSKNQRRDAISWGILGINRIDTQNKNLDRNFTLWPGICLPFGVNQVEHISVAEAAMGGLSLQDEQAMIQQAKERWGVSPALAAMGAGATDKKGKYGAMSTLAVMQAGNSRDAHRTSNFRHSAVKLYSMLTDFYGFMELGESELEKEALKDYLERKMAIPIRAADESMNKEITKQNQIILNQYLSSYVKQVGSMLQAAMNQAADANYRKWISLVAVGLTRLAQQTIKDFQLTDNPKEFVPDLPIQGEPNAQQPQQPQPGAGPIPFETLSQQLRARGGGGPGGTPQQPGMGAPPAGPSGNVQQ
jgi:hypothetical protein